MWIQACNILKWNIKQWFGFGGNNFKILFTLIVWRLSNFAREKKNTYLQSYLLAFNTSKQYFPKN